MQNHMQAVHAENITSHDFERYKKHTHRAKSSTKVKLEKKSEKSTEKMKRKRKDYIPRTLEDHTCSTCGFTTRSLAWLKIHTTSKHENSDFTCDLCDFTCSMKFQIKLHIESNHSPKDTYKCDKCNYECNREYYMKKHMKDKHDASKKSNNEESLICFKCGKVFKSASSLKSHIRIHDLELSGDLICKVCNAQYPSEHALYIHTLKIHTDQEPQFFCTHCTKTFYLEKSLKNHVKSSHVKKVQCRDENCSKLFPHKRQMEIHYRTCHEKVR